MRLTLYNAMSRYGKDADQCMLVRTWPLYLDLELASVRPSLTLPDIGRIIEVRRTPDYKHIQSRPLADAEVDVIQRWYEVASRRQADLLGASLAVAQNNITAQASAHHAENVELHQQTLSRLAKLERGEYIDLDGSNSKQLATIIQSLQEVKKRKLEVERLEKQVKCKKGEIDVLERTPSSDSSGTSASSSHVTGHRGESSVQSPTSTVSTAGVGPSISLERALCIKSPKVGLAMLDGKKIVENRTFKLPLGWHWIYISKNKKPSGLDDFANLINDLPYAVEEQDKCYGKIIGAIYLAAIRKPEECNGYLWARGPHCHIISHTIPLEDPVAVEKPKGPGTQWKFKIDEELQMIRNQIPITAPESVDLTPLSE